MRKAAGTGRSDHRARITESNCTQPELAIHEGQQEKLSDAVLPSYPKLPGLYTLRGWRVQNFHESLCEYCDLCVKRF